MIKIDYDNPSEKVKEVKNLLEWVFWEKMEKMPRFLTKEWIVRKWDLFNVDKWELYELTLPLEMLKISSENEAVEYKKIVLNTIALDKKIQDQTWWKIKTVWVFLHETEFFNFLESEGVEYLLLR